MLCWNSLNVKYKDTQKDGYPIIRKKFKDYYSKVTSEYYPDKPGGERGVFFELYKIYGYLPITTDSHLGEYIKWAYSVADHEAIIEFYDNYKKKCLTFYDNEKPCVKILDRDLNFKVSVSHDGDYAIAIVISE